MFKFDHWWLPDNERHMQVWMTKRNQRIDGRLTYQYHKYEAAMQFCKQRRVAVDVGAHVGFFSYWMKRDFAVIHAFEPVSEFAACWRENLELSASDDGEGDGDTNLHPFALGAHGPDAGLAAGPRDCVKMEIPSLGDGIDSGGTHVSDEEPDELNGEAVELWALDEFGLKNVDFIKIDCEGYEHHVIEGARETILRCKPCIIVEQKPHKLGPNFGVKGAPAVDMLRGMGAVLRREMSGDYIMSFE